MKIFKPQLNNYLNLLVVGFNGVGKTTLLKTISQDKKTLVVATENGLSAVAGYLNANSNVTVLTLESFKDLESFCKFPVDFIVDKLNHSAIEGNEAKPPLFKDYNPESISFDYVFMDSLTGMFELIENYYRFEYKNQNELTLKEWGLINSMCSLVLNRVLALNCHKIVTAHAKVNQGLISLRLNGEAFKNTVLDKFDFSFFLKMNEVEERFFVTSNSAPIAEGILNLTKTRDENQVLGKTEPANINDLVVKLNLKN